MIKRIIPIAIIGIAISSLVACNSKKSGFQNINGFEYKIIKDAAGNDHPKVGDLVYTNIRMLVDDSLIIDSRDTKNGATGEPVLFEVTDASQRGNFQSCFTVLTAGDSAIFRISMDSLKTILKGQPLPPFMAKGKYLVYQVSLVSVKTKDQYKKEMDEKASKQKDTDDKILQDYFAKNNLKPIKTASGLYYTIEKKGTGDKPTPGQEVTVNYTGMLMNGDKFDSNMDSTFHHMQPFSFVLGQHQVIDGWDEGISLLNKGSKATLYVPSPLAYGPQARSEKIQANSILIFNVELVDIKSAKK